MNRRYNECRDMISFEMLATRFVKQVLLRWEKVHPKNDGVVTKYIGDRIHFYSSTICIIVVAFLWGRVVLGQDMGSLQSGGTWTMTARYEKTSCDVNCVDHDGRAARFVSSLHFSVCQRLLCNLTSADEQANIRRLLNVSMAESAVICFIRA